jgi:hypothetical protein
MARKNAFDFDNLSKYLARNDDQAAAATEAILRLEQDTRWSAPSQSEVLFLDTVRRRFEDDKPLAPAQNLRLARIIERSRKMEALQAEARQAQLAAIAESVPAKKLISPAEI